MSLPFTAPDLPPALTSVLSGDSSLADPQLSRVLLAAASACEEISRQLRVLSLSSPAERGGSINVQGEVQKGMDVIANDVFIGALTGHVAAMASEEDEAVIQGVGNRQYEIAFDPLDGSSNLDSNLPTGTIFGVFTQTQGAPFRTRVHSRVPTVALQVPLTARSVHR